MGAKWVIMTWWRHGLFMQGIESPNPIENLTKFVPSETINSNLNDLVFECNMYSYELNIIQGVWKLFHFFCEFIPVLEWFSVNLHCFVPTKCPWSLALNNRILMNVLMVTSSWSRTIGTWNYFLITDHARLLQLTRLPH